MAQKRRMTAREKAEKEMRENGLLLPKKKPLNRKAFVEKAEEVLKERRLSGNEIYLYWALLEMLGKHDPSKGVNSVSPEAIGAAKVILLAARRMEFEEELGERSCTVGELFEAVKEIWNA